MLKEFKEFISRGSVVDLAVGTVIGAAFGTIVKSFVDDIISPLIGLLTNKTDLSDLQWIINKGEMIDGELVGATIVNYGSFIQAIINFLIIGFAIFMVIKAMNQFKRKEEKEEVVEEVKPSETELLREILNTLKEK